MIILGFVLTCDLAYWENTTPLSDTKELFPSKIPPSFNEQICFFPSTGSLKFVDTHLESLRQYCPHERRLGASSVLKVYPLRLLSILVIMAPWVKRLSFFSPNASTLNSIPQNNTTEGTIPRHLKLLAAPGKARIDMFPKLTYARWDCNDRATSTYTLAYDKNKFKTKYDINN